MRDRTAIFLQAVGTASTAAASVSAVGGSSSSNQPRAPTRNILKPTSSAGAATLLGKCRTVYKTLNALNNLMVSNASRYLASSEVTLASSSSKMTDSERDMLDREFTATSSQCKNSIASLKNEMTNAQKEKSKLGSEHSVQHFSAIVLYLEEYLDKLSQTHSKWKLERLQQRVEDRVGYVKRPVIAVKMATVEKEEDLTVDAPAASSTSSSPIVARRASATSMENEALHNVVSTQRSVSTSSISPMMGAVLDDDSHAPLDATTQELLLKENKQLERQLRTMVDQIRDVESQMATIASAQAFISSNIAQTRDDLELIQKQSVDIQSNFAMGNLNLQQAAQSGVTFRIFVLMFLLTLSFSLLVMHWTYD
eukprot:TRINITY_DN11855_c0_g1_i1.p1 TRINITY_DN11855_c0_g1~~TRINITY_DN11855_c0_g1_i1.p1  ORF type:complete len:367 (+),score=68.13 TRINITY_DN11855_c0_g1_i1:60-1160(+)